MDRFAELKGLLDRLKQNSEDKEALKQAASLLSEFTDGKVDPIAAESMVRLWISQQKN